MRRTLQDRSDVSDRPGGRRLFLHIGPHKTGTTSLQQALYDHRAKLAEQGLVVCHDEGFDANPTLVNAIRLANLLIRPALMTAPRANGRYTVPDADEQRTVMTLVRRFMRAAPGHQDFVISSEEFSLLRSPTERRRLQRLLGAQFETIVPVQ